MASGDVSGDSTIIFVDVLSGMVDDLRKIAERRATTPEQAAANLAEMRTIISRGRTYTQDQWIKKDLKKVFGEGFHQAGPGLDLLKADKDAATRHLNTLNRRSTVAFNSLDMWAQETSKRQVAEANLVKVRKIRQDLEAKVRKQTGSQRTESLKMIADAKGLETKLRKDMDSQFFSAGGEADPTITYRFQAARKGRSGKKGQVSSRQPADAYFKMLGHTGHQEMAALGYLRAAAKLEQYILVGDGPQCGWNSHNDTEKANGKIVPAEEAMKHPRAHPFCQRTFQTLDGKPGSRAFQKSLKQHTGTARRDQLQRIAKAGVVVGQVAGAAIRAGRNPLVARAVRNIIADSEINLPPAMERALMRWTGGYEQKERAILAARGLSMDDTDMGQFRQQQLQSFDDSLGNDEFLSKSYLANVKISDEQAALLGTKTSVTKGDLIERIEDYADYTRHQRSTTLGLADNLAAEAIDAEVREELFGEAAIRYYLAQPRIGSLHSSVARSLRVVKATIEQDPRVAGEEIVKTLATLITKAPWLSVKKAGLRFTLGITADGRRAIASEIYNRLADQTTYSKFERDLAQRLGIELAQRTITKQDIVNVFLPRLTYFSGKHINASIGLVKGNIQPIIRMYPSQTYLKWISMQSTLRTGALNDFIRSQLGDPGVAKPLRRALRDLGDDHLFTIDMFRNGPIRASIRMQGTELDSYALKLRPEQQWLRYNYRFYPRTVRTFMGWKNKARTYAKREVVFLHHEMVVLPRMRGGVMVTRRQEVRDLLIGALHMKGNIPELARSLGLSYESLLGFFSEVEVDLERRYDTMIKKVRTYNAALERIGGLRAIRSTADLRALANEYVRVTTVAPIRKSMQGPIPENLFLYVDGDLWDASHQSFRDDLQTFFRHWDDEHPNVDRPRFVMQTGPAEAMTYNARSHTITVSEEVAKNWVTYGRIRVKSVHSGWNPPGTDLPVSALLHEGMHAIIGKASLTKYRVMWKNIFESRGWAIKTPEIDGLSKDEIRRVVTRWIRDPRIARQVAYEAGNQALVGANEFLAELYSRVVAGDGGSRPATALLNTLRTSP